MALAVAITIGGFTATVQAQTIIYSDSMLGTVGPGNNPGTVPYNPNPLNGSTPDTVDTGGATWIANSGAPGYASGFQRTQVGAGSYYVVPQAGNAAYLPFTPTVGDSYVLQATFLAANGSGSFAGTEFGFTTTDTLQTGGGLPDGRLATVYIDPGGPNTANFNLNGSFANGGKTTVGLLPNGNLDPVTLTITLTAVGSGWNASAKGVDAANNATLFDYAPVALFNGGNIQYLGIGANGNATLFTNLTLTNLSETPEPSMWALLGVGMLALVFLQRRRAALHGPSI